MDTPHSGKLWTHQINHILMEKKPSNSYIDSSVAVFFSIRLRSVSRSLYIAHFSLRRMFKKKSVDATCEIHLLYYINKSLCYSRSASHLARLASTARKAIPFVATKFVSTGDFFRDLQ